MLRADCERRARRPLSNDIAQLVDPNIGELPRIGAGVSDRVRLGNLDLTQNEFEIVLINLDHDFIGEAPASDVCPWTVCQGFVREAGLHNPEKSEGNLVSRPVRSKSKLSSDQGLIFYRLQSTMRQGQCIYKAMGIREGRGSIL